MSWIAMHTACRLVTAIDIETCERCAGQVKVIACIEDPAVIERILAHLNGKAPSVGTALFPENRAPPQTRLFD
jgi:hypothetical protein